MQAIQKLPLHINNLKCFCRGVASKALKMINIEETDKGYSVLQMNRNPVNSLNFDFLQELNQAIKTLEGDKSCRGAIITSKLPVFCSGLELFEIYNPEPKRLEKLWRECQELKLNLFSSPLVLIAAINGPCLGAACTIPFSCDYRIMAGGEHTIGLPATKIGITPPFWLIESLKLLIGHREAEKMIVSSVLLKPKDALSKGVVDEVVLPEDLLSKSKEAMEKWLTIPDIGRIESKKLIRRNFIEEFQQKQDEDLEFVLGGMQNPKLQQLLGTYIKKLKQQEDST